MKKLSGNEPAVEPQAGIPSQNDKHSLLVGIIKEAARHADAIYVGFSGGLDSSYLLLETAQAMGSKKVIGVTVKAPTSSADEISEAAIFARMIGVRHLILDPPEFDSKEFRENNPDRCYHCKRLRYNRILKLPDPGVRAVFFDGTQADDNPDERPGSAAIRELGVATPLAQAGITKDEIRHQLRLKGLYRLAEKQAEPCLATRIPFGRPILESELEMVRKGEKILKDRGLKLVRLRHHGGLARIVTDHSGMNIIVNESKVREEIIGGLKQIGFQLVALDLDEYGHGA